MPHRGLAGIMLCVSARDTLFISLLQTLGFVRTPDIFLANKQNRDLVDCEEIFAELDKKCIGLKLYTAPLMPALEQISIEDGKEYVLIYSLQSNCIKQNVSCIRHYSS